MNSYIILQHGMIIAQLCEKCAQPWLDEEDEYYEEIDFETDRERDCRARPVLDYDVKKGDICSECGILLTQRGGLE